MATQDSDGTEIIGLEANVDGFTDTNADGVNDQYQVGGPVRAVKRDWYADGSLYFAGTNIKIGKVIGWFYLPTEGGSSMPVGAKSIDHNGDVYSSLTTHFNENIMYSNLSAGVSGYNRTKIDKIVIHHNATTNKNVAMATWYEANGNWTSAHYEIADNEIWGCVGEQYCAFHSGDAGMNMRSIGLEHLNATGAPSWTISEATYKSSAKLIADICKRYGLKPDSNTIIPHKQVSSTACPGGIDMARLIKMAQDEYNGKTAATQKEETEQGEEDMITISAPKRGIALMMGGKFLPILDPKTPTIFWNQGVKHYQLDTETFDAWQGKADKSTLDDATVEKLIKGFKK